MQARTVVLVAAIAVSAAGVWYFAPPRAPAPGELTDAVVLRAPPSADAGAKPAVDDKQFPMPEANASFASADAALRARATGGDGAAAWRWYREQRDCRRWHEWSAAPEGFAKKLIDGVAAADRDPPFFAMPPDEFEAFRNPANTAEVAAANAQNLMERLEALCANSVTASDEETYRIALAAAQSNSKQAKWNFIDAPPVDLSTNETLRRDWAARATALAEQQLDKGDAEAAFALGVAYAKDTYDEGYRGAIKRDAFNTAITNDPMKAYTLLTLYLATQPDPRRQERTQQLLADLGTVLSASDRSEAQAAAEALRIKQLQARED